MDKAMADAVNAAAEHWERTTRQATALVKATGKGEIAELEALFGFSQQDAVTHFVEQTEWGMETFPEYQNGQGSFQARLQGLLARWDDWESC